MYQAAVEGLFAAPDLTRNLCAIPFKQPTSAFPVGTSHQQSSQTIPSSQPVIACLL